MGLKKTRSFSPLLSSPLKPKLPSSLIKWELVGLLRGTSFRLEVFVVKAI